ncbi:unnamed protein product [Echinostoma caproni]|uniref:EF-hand domain-containing protein n=1 Tax=Echinostoma caproni TaxID=27848 RepID=A0A183ASF9_9TREM|nr:unnamed protein product [Echinostoma caproni]
MSARKTLEERFYELDADHNGFICREEFTQEIQRCGLPERLAERLLRNHDVNGDGQVTKEEFIASLTKIEEVIKILIL